MKGRREAGGAREECGGVAVMSVTPAKAARSRSFVVCYEGRCGLFVALFHLNVKHLTSPGWKMKMNIWVRVRVGCSAGGRSCQSNQGQQVDFCSGNVS